MGNNQSNVQEDPVTKKKREQILEEILNTERNYVNYLTIITDIYMEPLKAKSILKDDDLKSIFINIEKILTFHQEFFRELALCYNSFNWTNEIKLSLPTTTKKTLSTSKANRKTTIVTTTTTTTTVVGEDDDPSKYEITSLESTRQITEIFNSNADNFKMYSVYIIGYDGAMSTLARLAKKKSNFQNFLDKAKTDKNILDLNSLLIMPVQRLPRYALLLGELLKLSPESHPISKLLQNCVKNIKEVTAFINEAKRDDENYAKMLEIQEALIDKVAIVEPNRRLFFDGECQVHSIYSLKEEDALLNRIRKSRKAVKQSEKDKFNEQFVFPDQNRINIAMNFCLFNDCSVFLQKAQKTSFFNSNKVWNITSVSITEKMRFIDVLNIFNLTNCILVINEKAIFLIQMKLQDKEKFIKIFQMSKLDWGTYDNDHTGHNHQSNKAIEYPSILTLRSIDPTTSITNQNQPNNNTNTGKESTTTTTTTSSSKFFSLSSSTNSTSTSSLNTSTSNSGGSGLNANRKPSASISSGSSKKENIPPTTLKSKSKSMFFK